MSKKFTVIIPFLNEGNEVGLTCKSVRDTCGDDVDIIVINDNSNDNYDYVSDIKKYNVVYCETAQRNGCTVCRNRAVQLCKTPYFIILDAHCRFYTKDWLSKAIEIMERNEDCIYCCSVQYFWDETEHLNNKNTIGYGAYFTFDEKKPINASWNIKNLANDNEDTFTIPCLMGANYICSKRWWEYINGLEGITMWGRDEEFISLKSHLAGGTVKCINNILTAHKGRVNNKRPYVCSSKEVYHNEIAIAYIVLNEKFDDILIQLRTLYKDYINLFDDVLNNFQKNIDYYNLLKKQFEKIKKVDIKKFNDCINQRFRETIEKTKKV